MDEFNESDVLSLGVKSFMKASYYLFFLSGVCALRAANKYTMCLVYLITLLRIIQLVGISCKVKLVS